MIVPPVFSWLHRDQDLLDSVSPIRLLHLPLAFSCTANACELSPVYVPSTVTLQGTQDKEPHKTRPEDRRKDLTIHLQSPSVLGSPDRLQQGPCLGSRVRAAVNTYTLTGFALVSPALLLVKYGTTSVQRGEESIDRGKKKSHSKSLPPMARETVALKERREPALSWRCLWT